MKHSLLPKKNVCLLLLVLALLAAFCFPVAAQDAKKGPVTLIGVGDIIVDREMPDTIFQHVNKFLHSADIAYGNAEQTFSDKGFLVRGFGTNSEPRNIQAYVNAGFSVISTANNHTLDWGSGNLLDTLDRLKNAGLPECGAGKNIDEARRPVILERKGIRVGFLSYSSVSPNDWTARAEKPGLAPLRVRTIYEPSESAPGSKARIITITYREDLDAMADDIKKLKSQVDVVVVAMHWGLHLVANDIPMYCYEAGRAAVDAGADLILGTHPHVLKGLEMYKGKGIFYSTGNFAAEIGPAQKTAGAGEEIPRIYKGLGLVADPDSTSLNIRLARGAIIVKTIIEDGKIKRLSYVPIFANNYGEPEIVTRNDPRAKEVYDLIDTGTKSQKLKATFTWDGDEVVITP